MSGKPSDKICFVIAPIGDEKSSTRERSDKVLKHIIKPVAEKFGYRVIRADTIPKPGVITSQIIQHLVDDPLVVADLTEHNPNVFYELAIRHVVRKPIIQIIETGEGIPFDVGATRIIQVNHRDLDSVGNCKEELERQIQAVEKDPSQIDNPISVAVDLKSLRGSEDPEKRWRADVIDGLTQIRAEMSNLRRSVSRIDNLFPPRRSEATESPSLSSIVRDLYQTRSPPSHLEIVDSDTKRLLSEIYDLFKSKEEKREANKDESSAEGKKRGNTGEG